MIGEFDIADNVFLATGQLGEDGGQQIIGPKALQRGGNFLAVTEPLDEQGWDPITTFTAEEFVVTLADGSIPIKGTYRIDPTRNPKTVDWRDTIGEDAGKTLLAIYDLQDDRLIFCAAYPGLERPTEFRTRPGQVMRVFQREAQLSIRR